MIFVDESIQHNLGYICVGFVYCEESPDVLIKEAIIGAGLIPGLDEYKSGAKMEGDASRIALRKSIYDIVLMSCRLAVYIAPIDERNSLLTSIVDVANEIVVANGLESSQDLFVDEGIGGKVSIYEQLNVHYGCDSKIVLGIQLADFVAYHCSYLLKTELLGQRKKVLLSRDEPHLYSGEEVDFSWLIRTEFRRNFFVEPRDVDQIDGDDWFFKASGYGSFYGTNLEEEIMRCATKTFDSMYFGCVL